MSPWCVSKPFWRPGKEKATFALHFDYKKKQAIFYDASQSIFGVLQTNNMLCSKCTLGRVGRPVKRKIDTLMRPPSERLAILQQYA
jgi:hypothetical protein